MDEHFKDNLIKALQNENRTLRLELEKKRRKKKQGIPTKIKFVDKLFSKLMKENGLEEMVVILKEWDKLKEEMRKE